MFLIFKIGIFYVDHEVVRLQVSVNKTSFFHRLKGLAALVDELEFKFSPVIKQLFIYDFHILDVEEEIL